ncbi:tetratricopeptide repeat protein [Methylovulum psychrotolerans]|uniref:UDP-N-acetylglucosamine--peptide N-acetylglucosaminyltransferase SPINDLY n=1 Tax=Methylovulum psychrotolerans TaxID=1704499 RepID=A0A1Z4C1T7_9GAMM|nr:tetratricopeptide repeat protein [Methylovulum psychrotolerans]ASF47474.1 hypothetical protein CEK71_16180 [Methylovulum psychrotolerans]
MAPKKIASNVPCPCGSGKKYKQCCGDKASLAPTPAQQTDAAVTHFLNAGLAHQQAGQLPQAETCYRQLLQIRPHHPDALHLLGLIAYQLGKHAMAAQLISEAIRHQSDSPLYYNSLGLVLKEQGQLDAALAAHQYALVLKPDYAAAHNNLAVIALAQGDTNTAILHLQHALAIDPHYIEAHGNLGCCYKDKGEYRLAIACHQQAMALNPRYAPAYNNLGRTYEAAGDFTSALATYQQALLLDTPSALIHQNLSRVYETLADLSQAISHLRQALTISPNDFELRHTLALTLLKSGQFSEGWQYYESRYHPSRNSTNIVPPTLPFQQWQGEPLTGKSLLVWPEQGFGDEIQFCRYIPHLKALGAAYITLVCKTPLKSLFASLEGVDQLAVTGERIKRHDFWTFPLSLPLYCQSTLATILTTPYLSAPPERLSHWQTKLPSAPLRVGLVWKGAAGHKNDANRSISHLNILAPLFSLKGVAFISLQKGQGEEQAQGLPLTHLGSDIQDFADTAAIVAQLDLVICVDTVIAHLAGALGKPVWLLLPHNADWRWLTGRDDSPWYPQTVLFRQRQAGDWAELIGRVKERLKGLLGLAPPVSATDLAALLRAGLAHQQAGQLPQAEALYRQVLQTQPHHPDALHFLGLIAYQLDKHDIAVQLINAAIRYQPNNPLFYNNLGLALRESSQLELALAAHQKALALKPDYAQGHNNLAVLLKAQRDFTAAIRHFKQAIAIDPGYIEAHSNLGSCYKDIGDLDSATDYHNQAIALNPQYSAAYNNLGRVYEARVDLPQAIAHFRQAIALNPEDIEPQHNLAVVLLSAGQFSEGWQHYESRYHPKKKNRSTVPPKLPFRQWQGEPLAGKSLLIWPEQGFGDEIQFCRYITLLKSMGAGCITLFCKKPLQPLFASLAGVDQLLVAKEINSIEFHDFWTFPLSIPLHLQTALDTIPTYPHYLNAQPERISYWQTRLPEAPFRVGLVWKGSALHKNDANRSLSHLNALAPLFNLDGIAFISLQKGQGEAEAHGLPLTHLGSDIQDFADTAAIVAQLDLVICVDTVIAHLAGALGKPVWVLLPFAADWRWLTGRTDSPWYPQTVLFRQTAIGDWEGVVQRVREKLLALLADGKVP